MYVVRPETITGRVATVGTLLSNEEIEVRSEVAGRIERIAFKEGGRVKKRDLLVQINADEIKARLLSARYNEQLAAEEEERRRLLSEKQLASRQEYDAALTALNVARAELQLLQAQLAKTSIRAPFDGVAGLRLVSEGSLVTPTILITTFHDSRTVKLDFTLPERYAADIRPGDSVSFTVQGSSRKYSARVYAIPPRIEASTRTLRLRAITENRDGSLLPGGFANVDVHLKERIGCMVPSYAVIPELDIHKVFVCTNGRVEERTVRIGTRTEEELEITSGLSPGDSLITSGLLQIRPGMAVYALEPEQHEAL
jgi:membrane fusion protein (multidrug efflux system)